MNTEETQKHVESIISEIYNHYDDVTLYRTQHVKYLQSSLKQLSGSYMCFDASQPWIVYWAVHGLQILGETPDNIDAIIYFLSTCRTTGFGGGLGQMPHLATTYAAVMTHVALQRPVDSPEEIYLFLLSMKQPNGSFTMHLDGEADMRGLYTALAVASCLDVLDDALTHNALTFIKACQTYEGGFGGIPGAEAHGGYTYCAMASLAILNAPPTCINTETLTRWIYTKQMSLEGGFQGRTNKLVDACYSFWQTAVTTFLPHPNLFDTVALQRYILICAQESQWGGFRDKPGKPIDLYHTCYALSGLSIAQHQGGHVVGPVSRNLLEPVHPTWNLTLPAIDSHMHDHSICKT